MNQDLGRAEQPDVKRWGNRDHDVTVRRLLPVS